MVVDQINQIRYDHSLRTTNQEVSACTLGKGLAGHPFGGLIGTWFVGLRPRDVRVQFVERSKVLVWSGEKLSSRHGFCWNKDLRKCAGLIYSLGMALDHSRHD